MVYQGVIENGSRLWPLFITAAVLGSALTLASFVKATHSVFLGQMPEAFLRRSPKEVSVFMTLPMVVLALLCVVFGVFAQLPLKYYLIPAVAEAGAGSLEVAGAPEGLAFARGIWSPTTATLLIVLGIVLGGIIYLVGRASKIREEKMFIGGETLPPDTTHLSGTGFYNTIRELPLFRVLYSDGESGAYDLYYLSARYGNTLVQFLRRLHKGILPIYVGWVVIGLALLILYLVRL
jgi:NADH:ubiquinone oxidoreductase subunit 5 (subunit L)/multisubunit Na+/H+ antiporter MnhA subunit